MKTLFSVIFISTCASIFAAGDALFVEQAAAGKAAGLFPKGAQVTITLIDKNIPAWVQAGRTAVLLPSELKAVSELTLSDGENTMLVKASVEAGVPALCPAKNIIKGAVLRQEDLTYASMNLLVPGYNAFFTGSPKELFGLKAARPLHAGVFISKADLERQPDIMTGNNVTIKCEYNGITASDMGRAEEPGYAGAVIKVRNLKSKKIVMAKIVSNNLVQVEAR